eukprot:CAMPEP_0172444080 /NCGR_PEP_ID=MMETSP1065-20121228/4201_1 /TAXON_ID=265537 /ORGANISM="Amphiprora paludosa, Strain CCMP125" /LENGTH=100 /DNA_ID=CAMNT_0013194499 /DNA_START=41 /DNA_END=343 /DNA_ORIENTATION=+
MKRDKSNGTGAAPIMPQQPLHNTMNHHSPCRALPALPPRDNQTQHQSKGHKLAKNNKKNETDVQEWENFHSRYHSPRFSFSVDNENLVKKMRHLFWKTNR